jgi:D-beta-D-heptose 7-phosphate kinase/D-beta-D-heptose 1-phosphate adenosyltransferase
MDAFKEPSHDAVRTLLRAMTGRRVLVIGDAMLDCYIHGTSSRISPEAPVQIVQAEREEHLLGGAANVAKCLVALGARVTLCCVVGTDSFGDSFIEEARSLNIDTRLIFRDAGRPTAVKTRIVSGRQHLLRVDREGRAPFPEALMRRIIDSARAAVPQVDAILLSDYDKGVLSPGVCQAVIEAAGTTPVIVDPKGADWTRYHGAALLKPNWSEAQGALARRDSSMLLNTSAADNAEAEDMAQRLRKGLGVKNVLLTRSEHGMSLACPDNYGISFKTFARKVQDEAGAGDVVAAVACLALASGATVPESAWLGNVAAAAKVAKFGTQVVSSHDILEALGERFNRSERKLQTQEQAAQLAARLRESGKTVVFTNGCFDILHLGHVSYLENARQLGDALIVGVNTDESVKRLKGPERPVNAEADRARVISALTCVDAVVLFGEDTPLELIKAIQPNVLCKGGDYKRKEDVLGWEVVEARGGKVALIPLVEGRSTTKVIEKMTGK